MKFYAGIGSRQTPKPVLELMTLIAKSLKETYVLRSGGALGADTAFEIGATPNAEIFLPWEGIERHVDTIPMKLSSTVSMQAIEIAGQYHPRWGACSYYSKQFHGRNSMIMLGGDLHTPVEFVICWTPKGRIIGGTGQALRIAQAYNIPVYNLDDLELRKKIIENTSEPELWLGEELNFYTMELT